MYLLWLPAMAYMAGLAQTVARQPLGFPKSASDRVTLEARAMPASRIAQKLTAILGTPHRIQSDLASEPVIVRCRNVPAFELKDMLARALNAVWQTNADEQLLMRPKTLRNDLEVAERRREAKQIEKGLSKVVSDLKGLPGLYDRATIAVAPFLSPPAGLPTAAFEARVASAPTPAKTFLWRALADLDPTELANFEDSVTKVLARRPNAIQLRMGKHLEEHIKEFTASEDLVHQIFDVDSFALSKEIRFLAKEILLGNPSTEGVGQVLMHIRRSAKDLRVQLEVFNVDGSLRAARGSRFTLEPAAPDSAESEGGREFESWLRRINRAAELSATSREFETLVPEGFFPGGGLSAIPEGRMALSAECTEALFNPEKIDPLSLMVTDLLFALSEQSGKNLVARLPDSSYVAARKLFNAGKVDLEPFVRDCERTAEVSFDFAEDWLIVAPRRPLACESGHISRMALGEFMRSAKADGAFEFRILCKFHFSAGMRATDSPFAPTYQYVLQRTGVQPLYRMPDAPVWAMRWLGSLGDSAWQHLLKGEPLAVDRMPPASDQLLRNWASDLYHPSARKSGVTERQVPDEMLDGTMFMPNGAPSGSVLRVNFQAIPTVLNSIKRTDLGMSSQFSTRPVTAGDVASTLALYAKQGTILKFEDGVAGTYWIGGFEQFEFRVTFPQGIILGARGFSPDRIDRNARPVPYAQLPEDFRKDAETKFKELLAGG